MLLHAARPGAPTTLHSLVELTRRIAADVRAGRIDVRAGRIDVRVAPDRRWYHRLHGDGYLDIWLIGWATEQATELHDHAGSLGALTVVSGALAELRWSARTRGQRARLLPAADRHVLLRRRPARPAAPHPNRPDRGEHAVTVDELLAAARARLDRVDPYRAAELVASGAHLVDTRPAWQRADEGEFPDALVIERNHLEWRLDPASDARIAAAVDHDVVWIVACSEGYSSSLAAASLQDLGLRNATDLAGGFRAWRSAGLPVRRSAQPSGDTASLSPGSALT